MSSATVPTISPLHLGIDDAMFSALKITNIETSFNIFNKNQDRIPDTFKVDC